MDIYIGITYFFLILIKRGLDILCQRLLGSALKLWKILLHHLRALSLQHLSLIPDSCCCKREKATCLMMIGDYLTLWGDQTLFWFERRRKGNKKVLSVVKQEVRKQKGQEEEKGTKTELLRRPESGFP